MAKNKSFATIDKVKAAIVHTVGFLQGIHPDYYNRETIEQQILDHIAEVHLHDDINVYARKL